MPSAPSNTGSNGAIAPGAGPRNLSLVCGAGESLIVDVIMVQPAGAFATGVTGGGNSFFPQGWTRRVGSGEQQIQRFVTAPKAGLSVSTLSVAYTGTPEGIVLLGASYPGIEAWGNRNVASGNGENPSIALPLVLDPALRDPNAWIIMGIGDWTNTSWTPPGTATVRVHDGATGVTDVHGAIIDEPRDSTTSDLLLTLTKGANEWVALATEAWGIPIPKYMDPSDYPKLPLSERVAA
jgi:hypothetical protein